MSAIDSHVHLWDLQRTPQPWIDASMTVIDRDFGLAELAEHLAVTGAGSAVVVQVDHSLEESEWMLDQAAASAQVAGVVGWVDLDGDPSAGLARLGHHAAADRLVGIRHLAHVDADPSWLVRPGVIAGVRALGVAELAFDLVVRDHQLPLAAALAAAAPDTTLVLDHLGNPQLGAPSIHEWARELRALADHDRVVAKLSGLTLEAARASDPAARLREAVDVALEVFGPNRLMVGSDWPLVLLDDGGGGDNGHDGDVRWASTLVDLLGALSPSERELITRATAIASYGLGDREAAE